MRALRQNHVTTAGQRAGQKLTAQLTAKYAQFVSTVSIVHYRGYGGSTAVDRELLRCDRGCTGSTAVTVTDI